MQKKIISLAIASALTLPAMAFADTTIYGVLDAGYNQTKETYGANNATAESDAIGFSTMTSSRLGFVSSEDLGNGMKATAKIETGIGSNVMAGTTEGTIGSPDFTKGTSIATTSLGDRELNASLMMSSGTTIKAGYGSTMIRDISLGYAPDPGGNLVGNILNNNATFSSNRVAGVTVTQALDKASVAVQLSSNTNKVSGNPDLKSKGGYLIGGQYADGPIGVAAAYQDLETTANAGTVQSSDLKAKTLILGGSYDLGVAKIIAEYGNTKSDQSVTGSATNPSKANGLSVGAQAPFGAVLGFVQISAGHVNTNTNANSDQTQKGYTLGAKYNLSKATYGYASFGENKVDPNGALLGAKVDQFAIGLVQTF